MTRARVQLSILDAATLESALASYHGLHDRAGWPPNALAKDAYEIATRLLREVRESGEQTGSNKDLFSA